MSWIVILDQANRQSNKTIAGEAMSHDAAKDAEADLVILVATPFEVIAAVILCLLAFGSMHEAINGRYASWWQYALFWIAGTLLALLGACLVRLQVISWVRFIRRHRIRRL